MCPGLMDGQLIVCIEDASSVKSILILIMSSNPELTKIKKIFQFLILERFPQCIIYFNNSVLLFDGWKYIGFTEEKLCPKCISLSFTIGKEPVLELGVIHGEVIPSFLSFYYCNNFI